MKVIRANWTEGGGDFRDKTKFPVEKIPTDKLIGTQKGLNTDILNKKISSRKTAPIVVSEHEGNYYIENGHHRAGAAILKNQETIEAHVMTKARMEEVKKNQEKKYKDWLEARDKMVKRVR